MIVMVEGPAAAGKTSFIETLAHERPNVKVVPELVGSGRDEPKGLALFMSTTIHKAGLAREYAAAHPDSLVVVDRGHASVLAFAYIEEQVGLAHDVETAEDWYTRNLELGALVIPDLYVYITAPPEIIVARAQAGGWYRDDLAWVTAPEAAMEYYEQFFAEQESRVPIIRLDGTKDSAELVAEFNEALETA